MPFCPRNFANIAEISRNLSKTLKKLSGKESENLLIFSKIEKQVKYSQRFKKVKWNHGIKLILTLTYKLNFTWFLFRRSLPFQNIFVYFLTIIGSPLPFLYVFLINKNSVMMSLERGKFCFQLSFKSNLISWFRFTLIKRYVLGKETLQRKKHLDLIDKLYFHLPEYG